jgi:hypothetical protein
MFAVLVFSNYLRIKYSVSFSLSFIENKPKSLFIYPNATDESFKL